MANPKLNSKPAIEIIKPRSGNNPFLKVTFIGDGEKREFTRYNKTSPNKFETSSLTPIAAQAYEREAKSKVKNEVANYLSEKKISHP